MPPVRLARSRGGAARLSVAVPLALIVLLTALVYAPVRNHPFIGLDDTRDIAGNRWVRSGLTAEGVQWAFAAGHPPYWHPLTTLSHMADVSLFGLRAGAHLGVNAALHGANACLLATALGTLTGAWWPSALAALLFAVHPLRVESVAWAAERRDVLSGLFWMLALLAYARFARRPSGKRLLAVLAAFALGLLSKPMVVTLPIALLVLDGWPLGRNRAMPWRRLALGKVPLLLLALPVAALTWVVVGRTTFSARAFPLGERLANAAVSPIAYLRQTLWPADLAIFYPHPSSLGARIPPLELGMACLALAGISLAALLLRRSRPWLLAGWMWFLATLAPVLGIVQNWEQARADRFTYLPLIGIFVALAWEAAALGSAMPRLRLSVGVASAVTVAFLALAARSQVGYWRDPETLFRRALAVTRDNWLAEAQLGVVLLRQGRLAEAEERLRRALALRPLYPVAHNNLAIVLDRTGRTGEAAEQYEEALRQDPGYADAAVNLGTLRLRGGEVGRAAALYEQALAADPRHAAASFNLGLALEAQGRAAEAVPRYEAALREDPRVGAARERLRALGARGAQVEGPLRR